MVAVVNISKFLKSRHGCPKPKQVSSSDFRTKMDPTEFVIYVTIVSLDCVSRLSLRSKILGSMARLFLGGEVFFISVTLTLRIAILYSLIFKSL